MLDFGTFDSVVLRRRGLVNLQVWLLVDSSRLVQRVGRGSSCRFRLSRTMAVDVAMDARLADRRPEGCVCV